MPAIKAQAPTDPDNFRVAKHWIAHFNREFKQTGNPVFVWEVIGVCLGSGIAFPGPVLNYLSRTPQPKFMRCLAAEFQRRARLVQQSRGPWDLEREAGRIRFVRSLVPVTKSASQ